MFDFLRPAWRRSDRRAAEKAVSAITDDAELSVIAADRRADPSARELAVLRISDQERIWALASGLDPDPALARVALRALSDDEKSKHSDRVDQLAKWYCGVAFSKFAAPFLSQEAAAKISQDPHRDRDDLEAALDRVKRPDLLREVALFARNGLIADEAMRRYADLAGEADVASLLKQGTTSQRLILIGAISDQRTLIAISEDLAENFEVRGAAAAKITDLLEMLRLAINADENSAVVAYAIVENTMDAGALARIVRDARVGGARYKAAHGLFSLLRPEAAAHLNDDVLADISSLPDFDYVQVVSGYRSAAGGGEWHETLQSPETCDCSEQRALALAEIERRRHSRTLPS